MPRKVRPLLLLNNDQLMVCARGGTQNFRWSAAAPTLFSQHARLCADGHGLKAGDNLVLRQCLDGASGQQWLHDGMSRFVNKVSGLCLDKKVPNSPHPKYVGVQECSESPTQKWSFKVVKSAKA